MASIAHVIGKPGVEPLLQHLVGLREVSLPRDEIENHLLELGATSPALLLDEMMEANLVHHIGPRIGVSDFGHRATLLIEALNGGDIAEIFPRLRQLSGLPEMYELVREGM